MTQTAITYGSSLYDLAREENAAPLYMEQLRVLREILNENPEYLPMLSSRALPLQERLHLLDEAFRGRIEPYLLNFMKILCEKGAVRELPGCIRQFELLWNDEHGILEAAATSAVPLSPAMREKLTRKLAEATGKTVLLTCRTDPALLGGVRVEYAGHELDGTVRRRLDELGKQLEQLTL